MVKQASGIAGEVTALIDNTIKNLGFSLWDVEYVKEGSTWYLRITIDSEKGVDLNDCELVHRTIDPILDDADPIDGPYTLEVSSPGLERNIRTREHFIKCNGEVVQIKLFRPINGSNIFIGKLSFDDSGDTVELTESNGVKRSFELKSIAKANVYFEM